MELVNETATRWATNLHRVGRTIRAGPVPVRLAPGAVEQVLDGLMDNTFDNDLTPNEWSGVPSGWSRSSWMTRG